MAPQTEIELYLNRAYQDLEAAESNLQMGFYGVAVARAYYAMFYAASALLTSKAVSCKRHSGVLSAFGEHFVKTGLIETKYAKMLGHAFDSRLDSDYDMTFIVEQTLAEAVLSDAGRFADRAAEHLRQAGAP